MKTLKDRMSNIIDVLENNKALDCKMLNLQNNDYFADGVIISTALNTKHTSSLVVNLQKTIKTDETFLNLDDSSDGWIVIDMCDIIVHIMTKDYRDNFSLDDFFDKLLSFKKEND